MRILINRTVFSLAKIVLFTALLTACGIEVTTSSDVVQPTPEQSSRILTQATFGPTAEELKRLELMGTGAWFNDQFAKPQTLHLVYLNRTLPTLAANQSGENLFLESFWQQAIQGDDQLRQRVTFALSQIFVISFQNDTLANMPRGVAHYYDTLGAYAFGNFRELLEAVTLHPTMGVYLSSLRNQRSDGARVPDENYAREIMQLFTIGLRKLNADGSDAGAATYTNEDIQGLAKVFTGWSWAGPDKTNGRFYGNNTPAPDPNRDWLPMQNYPLFHEALYLPSPEIPKSVLLSDSIYGVTIPQNTSGEASLKIALDTLFNHPNVGPFIGRQLIQRLVTSNPSPAYIASVTAAFNNNGQGVRGDMKAVIKAVLLFPIVNPTLVTPAGNTAGKVREPVIRMANWMRAFHVRSASGRFPITSLDNTTNSLGQTPMSSPTVFNFYRPDYKPANTALATNGLNAPEMQIIEETSVVGYLNFMRCAIQYGAGYISGSSCSGNFDIKADYTPELALAATPDLLIEHVNLLLMQGEMSTPLKDKIRNAINANINNSAKNKVYLAIYLTMASPEYIVQK
jgi:uncharacterized protein (DUF1800 family)